MPICMLTFLHAVNFSLATKNIVLLYTVQKSLVVKSSQRVRGLSKKMWTQLTKALIFSVSSLPH